MTCNGLEEAECRDESGPSVLELLSLRSSSSSSRFRVSRKAVGLTGSDVDVPDTLDAENYIIFFDDLAKMIIQKNEGGNLK